MAKLDNFYEIQGTPLIPDDMPNEDDAASFVLPTQAELDSKQTEDNPDDPTTTGTETDPTGPDAGADANTDKDAPADAADKPDPDQGAQGTPEAPPLPAFELTDPGDYQPQDYSFEVTTYEGDNRVPKVHKITESAQLDQLLDQDADFGTQAAVARALRASAKMETSEAADKREWELAKREYDELKATHDADIDRLTKLSNELTYLTGKGKLPVIAKQYQNADWSDPAVAKQPGVKEQIELIQYLAKENRARKAAGLDEMNASQALAELTAERAERKLDEATKQQGEQRRANGAKVQGTTPAPVQAAKKGVMVGEVIPGGLSGLSNYM